MFLLAVDMDDLFFELLVAGRKADLLLGERRVLGLFPSDARVCWELDLTLDVSRLGGGCSYFVVPVRRGEDAKGDRDAGVKVQVDDLSGENSSRMPFDVRERKTRRGLLLLGKEGRRERVGRSLTL